MNAFGGPMGLILYFIFLFGLMYFIQHGLGVHVCCWVIFRSVNQAHLGLERKGLCGA